MSELKKLITVKNNGKQYIVVSIKHATNTVPIVLDLSTYKYINRLDRKWYINEKNHIYCVNEKGGDSYQIYMHDIVMRINIGNEHSDKPIIHINNIHFDNRFENLQFDVRDKDHLGNKKKKRRTINLDEYGIDVDELPTYIWYLKPDKSHGSRFVVDIPNSLSWRSTSSKKVSLRYKLEESKKYLRYMMRIQPNIFKKYSMNGDLNKHGLRLYNEYRSIIKLAGFAMNRMPNNNTDYFLKENVRDLNNFELYLLRSFDPTEGNIDVNYFYNEYGDLIEN